MDQTISATCHCGHSEEAHQHYRSGTDCSKCGCTSYRLPRWQQRLRRRLGV